jgi:hypothetical protein
LKNYPGLFLEELTKTTIKFTAEQPVMERKVWLMSESYVSQRGKAKESGSQQDLLSNSTPNIKGQDVEITRFLNVTPINHTS